MYKLRSTIPDSKALTVDGVTVAWVIRCKHDHKWYWCNVGGYKDDKGEGFWWTPEEAASNFMLKKGDKLAKRIEHLKGNH